MKKIFVLGGKTGHHIFFNTFSEFQNAFRLEERLFNNTDIELDTQDWTIKLVVQYNPKIYFYLYVYDRAIHSVHSRFFVFLSPLHIFLFFILKK